MKFSLVRFLLAVAALGAVAFAGAYAGTTYPRHMTPTARLQFPSPDACGSPVTEPVRKDGGAFKIPSCGGTTGDFTYGPNDAPRGLTVMLTASLTNPGPSVCGSASGETTVGYLQVLFRGTREVAFNTTLRKSMLKNSAFPPRATFSLWGYVGGEWLGTEQLGLPNSKHEVEFASPFNGQTFGPFGGGITTCFELDSP